MRVVLDCNVLISATLSPRSTCQQVLNEVTRFHTPCYSRETLHEFLTVAKRFRVRPYLPRVKKIVKSILRVGIEVTTAPESIELPDPDDVMYLQTALAARADVLITGNLKDFPFEEYEGVRILSPRGFLNLVHG